MPKDTGYILDKYTIIIKDNIAKYYPDMSEYSSTVRGESLGGKYATTFRYTILSDSGNIILYLKICPIYESLDPAKSEYETLRKLYLEVFSENNNLAVARPIDYFPEDNAYLQESVGVTNLRSYLLKYNSILLSNHKKDNLVKLIAGSATWLKEFHAGTMSDRLIMFSANDFISSIEGEFDYNALSNFKFKIDVGEKIKNLMAEMLNSEITLTMPGAKWHWDYTPGHVYIDNCKISVIDILGMDDVPIYEDIGHFLASLSCINNLPSHLLFSHKRSQTLLCSVFVEKYLENNSIDKEEAMLFINLYKIKYLVIYFIDQFNQVCNKTITSIGYFFANYRLVPLIEKVLLTAIDDAARSFHKLNILNQ